MNYVFQAPWVGSAQEIATAQLSPLNDHEMKLKID